MEKMVQIYLIWASACQDTGPPIVLDERNDRYCVASLQLSVEGAVQSHRTLAPGPCLALPGWLWLQPQLEKT
jgi:hypothetical protein